MQSLTSVCAIVSKLYGYLKLFTVCDHSLLIVWFQKISIPPPQRVIGNSEGEGVSKTKISKGKYQTKLEIPVGWGA